MGYIHEDDARTMAAAPDLLEACREALRRCSYSDDMEDVLRAAIAKATGA
jgi:hypothetical protein